jgi:hypothetical protein
MYVHVLRALEFFKASWGKGYHMVYCWHAVNNAPKWKLGYAPYKINIQNGGSGVAVAVYSEDETPGQNALPSGRGAISPPRPI